MDLVSLLITLIGIMVLLGLYLMSRLYDQSPHKQADKSIKIPNFTDTEGNQLSSIKADFPATAARYPTTKPAQKTPGTSSITQSTPDTSADKNQYVLFIASQTSEPLQGDKILAAMEACKLHFGEKDIYHYYVNKDKSLFSVANGVSPWTLKTSDLAGTTTPGLSLIMRIPTPIDSIKAIDTFVEVAEKLAVSIDGELQNARQQIFLPTDKEEMLKW